MQNPLSVRIGYNVGWNQSALPQNVKYNNVQRLVYLKSYLLLKEFLIYFELDLLQFEITPINHFTKFLHLIIYNLRPYKKHRNTRFLRNIRRFKDKRYLNTPLQSLAMAVQYANKQTYFHLSRAYRTNNKRLISNTNRIKWYAWLNFFRNLNQDKQNEILALYNKPKYATLLKKNKKHQNNKRRIFQVAYSGKFITTKRTKRHEQFSKINKNSWWASMRSTINSNPTVKNRKNKRRFTKKQNNKQSIFQHFRLIVPYTLKNALYVFRNLRLLNKQIWRHFRMSLNVPRVARIYKIRRRLKSERNRRYLCVFYNIKRSHRNFKQISKQKSLFRLNTNKVRNVRIAAKIAKLPTTDFDSVYKRIEIMLLKKQQKLKQAILIKSKLQKNNKKKNKNTKVDRRQPIFYKHAIKRLSIKKIKRRRNKRKRRIKKSFIKVFNKRQRWLRPYKHKFTHPLRGRIKWLKNKQKSYRFPKKARYKTLMLRGRDRMSAMSRLNIIGSQWKYVDLRNNLSMVRFNQFTKLLKTIKLLPNYIGQDNRLLNIRNKNNIKISKTIKFKLAARRRFSSTGQRGNKTRVSKPRSNIISKKLYTTWIKQLNTLNLKKFYSTQDKAHVWRTSLSNINSDVHTNVLAERYSNLTRQQLTVIHVRQQSIKKSVLHKFEALISELVLRRFSINCIVKISNPQRTMILPKKLLRQWATWQKVQVSALKFQHKEIYYKRLIYKLLYGVKGFINAQSIVDTFADEMRRVHVKHKPVMTKLMQFFHFLRPEYVRGYRFVLTGKLQGRSNDLRHAVFVKTVHWVERLYAHQTWDVLLSYALAVSPTYTGQFGIKLWILFINASKIQD